MFATLPELCNIKRRRILAHLCLSFQIMDMLLNKKQQIISTTKIPAAVGPYSQAVASGSLLFLSGQIPLVPETGALVEMELTAAHP